MFNILSVTKEKLIELVLSKYRKKIFEIIFKYNLWGSSESVSGPGPTLEVTKNLREFLEKIRQCHIRNRNAVVA